MFPPTSESPELFGTPNYISPRRLGLLFLLDQKQKQKNQVSLMQPCNGTERSSMM